MPASDDSQPCPTCGAPVEVGDAEPLAKLTCAACGAAFKVQRKFGGFLVTESLGAGGMGSVYKACDTRLDRLVALKLLRSDLGSDKDYTAELQREARITASITHPHVVKVFSFGSDYGQFYLVMELVDHGSLDDLIELQKRVSEEQVLDVGLQVARGLQAAHAAGLIHRDIKPANILFSDERTAKIADFGLAVLGEQNAEVSGELWGTPYYIAPERLVSEPEDFRSDIYSLGATMYHALSGKPMFEGNSTSATELRELKAKPIALQKLLPEAAPETCAVIERMLAFDVAHRHGSYRELIAELEQAKRVVYQRLHPDQKSFGWKRPLAALLLLSALGGGGFYAWKHRSASAATAAVPLPPVAAIPGKLTATPPPKQSAAEVQARKAKGSAAAELAQPEQAKAAAAEAERQRLLAAETPGWNAALVAYRTAVARYQFPEAVAALQKARVTEPSLQKAQEQQACKARWLVAWQSRLIADLNHGGLNGTFQVGSMSYSGIAGATGRRVTMKVPFGTTELDWTKLTPQNLLAVSNAFIKSNAPDVADRQWLSAVFAAETGQTEAARTLATKAAQAKPAYEKELETLGLPVSS